MLGLVSLISFVWIGSLPALPATPTGLDEHTLENTLPENAVAILSARCVSCHGADKAEGGLRLDSRENLLAGGDGGEVILLAEASASRLVASLRSADPDVHMPPKESLPEPEITALERWIAAGAEWPATSDSKMQANDPAAVGNAWEDPNNPIRKLFRGERLNLWSLRPVVRPVVPTVERIDWPVNAIDCFVLSRWERDSVFNISPDANPRKLALRVSMDLTGLPPTPEQLEQYTRNADPLAYER